MSDNDEKVVVFARSEVFPPMRGTWFRSKDGGTAQIGCPTCGQGVGVSCPPHTVKPDGLVWPSYRCGHGCGFHAMIQLDGLDVPEGTCPTCAHQHVGVVCPAHCGCLAGTPEGRPQPVAFFSEHHRLLVGMTKEHVVLGVGDETALSILLDPAQAVDLAKHLFEMARRLRPA